MSLLQRHLSLHPCRCPSRRSLSAESDITPCTTHLDGMWAQLESGVPTANGYSGAAPPGWRDLEFNQAHLPDKIWRLGPALDRWCATRGLPREQVAWIRLGDPPPASGLRIADR